MKNITIMIQKTTKNKMKFLYLIYYMFIYLLTAIEYRKDLRYHVCIIARV